MKERDWDRLVWSLQRNSCILLLGPEVVPASAGSPISAAALARELADELGVSPGELPQIAQQYASHPDFGYVDLQRRVVKYYSGRQPEPPPLHRALASLPFYLIVSSCHDRLIQAALETSGKKPVVDWFDYRGQFRESVAEGTVAAPLVYQLYGSPVQPRSLVLTENDLLDFLVAVISKNPGLPNNLRSEIQKRGVSFLFLGFGIRHWYLRILLHVLKFNSIDATSFALELATQLPAPQEFEQTILFYKQGYRIELVTADPEAFVGELTRRYVQSVAEQDATPTAPGPGAPKVFVSYARENQAFVDQMYVALQSAGLNPWVDRHQLEAGDSWDAIVRQRIEEADYFVVVQSRALTAKTFSYVNKELSLALDRQRYARTGVRFIIPVSVDDSPLLPEISSLQMVKADSSSGMQSLISAIRRDQERRARANG